MFETTESVAWMVLFLPLIAAVIIAVFTRANPRVSAQISVGAVFVSFLLTIVLYSMLSSSGETHLPQMRVPWLWIGHDLQLDIGLKLDYLSLMMALIVTGVGGIIHVFSTGYMEGDRAKGRYFAYLSLFT